VMNFENKTASTNEEKCELFAEFIQRTYTDDQWVPSDSGPTVFLMMFRWVQCSSLLVKLNRLCWI
jgi:hypothetical protein